MGTKFVALATAILASLTICTAQAAEPKHGGILKIYHRETPPSLSIHEEATFSVNAPAMGIFNNLVIYDQHKPQNSIDTIVPELATSWAWDKANTALTFKLRQGVKWHDGVPFTAKDVKCTFDLLQGKAQDKFRKNPRKDWYEQRHRRHDQRRLRGDVPSQAAAALAAGDARLRLHADLSLPRARRADAHASDRHRPVQVRRDEAERVDQAREESRLLEKGSALSRRHRIHHHQEPRDRGARLRRRQGRHDLPDRDDGGAGQGHQVAGPDRDLRNQADQRQHQSHRQSRAAAVQQSGTAQGDGAVRSTASRSSTSSCRGRATRRLAAAAAGRRLGPAAGYSQDHPGLWRREEGSRASPRDHDEAGLRRRTSRSRSRCRRAISRPIAIRPWC